MKIGIYVFSLILGFAPYLGANESTGVLILAHGTSCHEGDDHHGGKSANTPQDHCENHLPEWERYVVEAVSQFKDLSRVPVELAFGMWEAESFQAGIDRLQERTPSIENIVILPLFISPHSEVIEMQEYMFGLREKRSLPIPVKKIQTKAKIRYLEAMGYDSIISQILTDRAKALLEKSGEEASETELLIVMHGPVADNNNYRWMSDGYRYAADLASLGFAEIHPLSLRDDSARAGDEMTWQRAKEILRETVKGAQVRDRKALVLPLLVSRGGIEEGIHERLEGLDYIWTGETLLPDPRMVDYLKLRLREYLK